MDTLILIALLGITYIILSRIFTKKFVNKKHMEEYQKKMKEISKRYAEATKNNDVKELEKIHEIQKKEVMPKMKGIFIEQIKMFVIIMILFTLALHILPYLDHTKDDDIYLNLTANDSKAILADKAGIWWIEIKEGARSHATLKINVDSGDKNYKYENETKYEGNLIYTNKKTYKVGDKIKIYNKGDKPITLTIDRGTRPSIYLGIPFLERIEGEYGVFLFIIIIGGLIFSVIEKIITKTFKNKKVE